MSLVTALLAGGLLGMRHAVETDPVAAVAALVDRVAVGLLLLADVGVVASLFAG